MFSPRGVRRQSVETQKHLRAVMHHHVTVAAFKGKGDCDRHRRHQRRVYSLSGCRVGFLFPGAGRFQGRGEM